MRGGSNKVVPLASGQHGLLEMHCKSSPVVAICIEVRNSGREFKDGWEGHNDSGFLCC